MLKTDAKKIANHRLKDAEVLFNNKRYAGSAYICGYAIECYLKYKICEKLNWVTYPPNVNFKNYKSFKTHDLDILLSLTGLERKIKKYYTTEWFVVKEWDPEVRRYTSARITKAETNLIINSTKTLLKKL